MFFPEQARALSEAYRVLKPSGRFLFNVWDRIEENEFAEIVVKSVATLFPNNPPMLLARTPHGHYDTASLEAQLRAVGFGAVTTEIVARESRAPNALSVAIGYCQGTPMRNEIEAHDPDRLRKRRTLRQPQSPSSLGLDRSGRHSSSAPALPLRRRCSLHPPRGQRREMR
jgi:SAM-dependent methyltransferase